LALDAWARVRRGDNKNERDWKRLNAVARAADPEPWRNRFRQAWASLDNKERTAELEKLASAAKVEELLPDSISLLATALGEANRTEQAITLLRTAQRRYSGNFWINQNLAFFLANASPPRNDEAIRYYFASIAARPDYPVSRVDLGISLHKKGEIDEAIVCYREAIRLKPDYANAHSQLGNALSLQRKFAEAEANCRQAIEIEPDNYFTHQTLGDVLIDQQKYTEAETAFRKAIEIKPDFWVPHLGLGDALRQQGRFAEALTSLKRAQELGSGKEDWQLTDEALVGVVERLAWLDAKLPRILTNEISPADTSERLALARLCQLACRQNYGAAVRFYSEAFATNPKLADDMKIQYRYSAACAAALAGCGQGKDAAHLERDLAHFRGQALSWLQADLAAWDARLKMDFAKEAAKVRQILLRWQQDSDFNGVRGAEALAKLPDTERREWQKLWDEVAELERRASVKK
jgi:eukaryotic-like serine/threonine-protein kinase